MSQSLVLITRPTGQHEAFAQQCETLGFAVALLPCLQIRQLDITQAQLRQSLDQCKSVLFTSANAVRIAQTLIPMPWNNHDIHAIGAATATALEKAGQMVAITPQSPYNSEAYLAQLDTHVQGSLLIIKGLGGRGLIGSALRRSGWQVDNVDLYERVCPSISQATIDSHFTHRPPDIISVTSDEILNNLWQASRSHQHTLKRIQLIVNSERCAALACQLGFIAQPLVARPAGDTGQLAALTQWKASLIDRR